MKRGPVGVSNKLEPSFAALKTTKIIIEVSLANSQAVDKKHLPLVILYCLGSTLVSNVMSNPLYK